MHGAPDRCCRPVDSSDRTATARRPRTAWGRSGITCRGTLRIVHDGGAPMFRVNSSRRSEPMMRLFGRSATLTPRAEQFDGRYWQSALDVTFVDWEGRLGPADRAADRDARLRAVRGAWHMGHRSGRQRRRRVLRLPGVRVGSAEHRGAACGRRTRFSLRAGRPARMIARSCNSAGSTFDDLSFRSRSRRGDD